jgi:hypothetical protein
MSISQDISNISMANCCDPRSTTINDSSNDNCEPVPMFKFISSRITTLKVFGLLLVLNPTELTARNVAVFVRNSEYSYLSRLPNAARDAEARPT